LYIACSVFKVESQVLTSGAGVKKSPFFLEPGFGTPLFRANALCTLQCVDTDGWVTGRTTTHEKPRSNPEKFFSRTDEAGKLEEPAEPD